jgi:hypothetical protein
MRPHPDRTMTAHLVRMDNSLGKTPIDLSGTIGCIHVTIAGNTYEISANDGALEVRSIGPGIRMSIAPIAGNAILITAE